MKPLPGCVVPEGWGDLAAGAPLPCAMRGSPWSGCWGCAEPCPLLPGQKADLLAYVMLGATAGLQTLAPGSKDEAAGHE